MKRLDEVWLSNSAKKLVLKMKSDFPRTDPESLYPNLEKMMSLRYGSAFKEVIVTTTAGNSKLMIFIRSALLLHMVFRGLFGVT